MVDFSNIKNRLEINLATFQASAESVFDNLPLSTSWLQSDLQSHPESHCAALLHGAKLALLEVCSTWSIGFSRGSAGSLRTYTENLMAWLYYKDHPVEYAALKSKISDMLLPKACQTYFKNVDKNFDLAYKFCEKSMKRPNEYYYTDLSYYIHAHPSQIIVGETFPEAVVSTPPDPGFLTICGYIDEFISDNFASYYRHSWGLYPLLVQQNLETRLGGQLSKFIEQ